MGWFRKLGEALDMELFSIAGTDITLATLLSALLIVIGTLWASKLAQRAIRKAFAMRGVGDESSSGLVTSVAHYSVWLIGFAIALQTLGIDLSALFAAGAAFAVAIGFAMQNVVQNFVAGILLLVERTIKPGDVLEVDGEVVRVVRLGIRATVAVSRDGEDLLIPNSALVQNTVKNYTLQSPTYRVRTLVGVTYDSDLKTVNSTLSTVAAACTKAGLEPAQVLLVEFGDNAVIFEVAIWTTEPWASRRELSALNDAIWWALKEQDIVIAFPQLDVHFDGPRPLATAS